MTDEEKLTIIEEVLNQIEANSQSADALEEVSTLDGIDSLPAMRGDDVVRAPLSLLGAPATEAAAVANTAAAEASAAASAADAAATDAVAAKDAATLAADEADAATTNAIAAAEVVQQIAEEYEVTANAGARGATTRIDGIVEGEITLQSGTAPSVDGIYYLQSAGCFAAKSGDVYYGEWDTADLYMSADRTQILKDKIYLLGETLYAWSEDDATLTEASSSGGGNTINVTTVYPLESGYYTLSTAIAAVEEKRRCKGCCITYETTVGKWETKQFVGTSLTTWTETASWVDFGGAGTVKSLTLNGTTIDPDEDGNVNLVIEEVQVDESLDTESTNPVQNKAVASRLNELSGNTISGSDVETSEDGNTVTVSLTNQQGGVVTSFEIPAGSGGSGSGSTTKVVLSAAVDQSIIKEGSSAVLTYSYDHQYNSGDANGESTGQKATITITVKRGTTVAYTNTLQDISKGSYTLNLSDYLLSGTNDVYVLATTTDPTTGTEQRKQAYVSVKVVSLSLTSSYSIASGLSNGGYSAEGNLSIPFAITGTGSKVVTLYLDGVQADSQTITRSGTTNGSFSVSMAGLSAGKHSLQMVAEMAASESLTLLSESIYMDFCIQGSGAPFVGLKIVNSDGRIFGPSQTPSISVGQYRSMEISFVAYDPVQTPATVTVLRDGVTIATLSAPRTVQTITNRFAEQGTYLLAIGVGESVATLNIEVVDGGVEISEATYGLVAKWSADGRSNGESSPAEWTSGDYSAVLTGFDWSSNGWTGSSLKLTNGAKVELDYKPFETDAASTGLTVEFEIKVSNVADRSYNVISCIDNGMGLSVTTQEASFKTGTSVTYTNEDGDEVTRDIELSSKYAPNEWLKVAFAIQPRSESRLMELYLNGVLSSADLYDRTFSFMQGDAQNLVIQSDEADVELRNIRIYNRCLSDDELLENYIVDRTDADEMLELYDDNDVMGGQNEVDIDVLRQRGRGVMRFVRTGGLDELNMTNNKKTDFECDIYFYSPMGSEYDFVLKDCYVRIQGTSSTKYPRKNYRIYMNKGGEQLALYVDGSLQENRKYKMRPTSIANNVFCMKADYSDSSMALNTGVAKLYNDVMKELGLLTPPQQYEYENGGEVLSAISVRSAIDGFPIDIFGSETDDGENTYYGQYNFNNEKSKSGKLFGMEGVDGFEPVCPITLEFLNNTARPCLFQSDSDEDLTANFDAACEFNYPEDVTTTSWTTEQETAIKRLWGWIRDCVPAGADADDISTWVSSKFASELDDYFDRQHLCTWYVFTDYFMSVDQRAKNMLLRTWDGLIWYITYYDGDTALGRRNDSFLKYDYTLKRETWDAEASKYAFEGHDSWLWNMLLANCMEDIKTAAANFRTKMTTNRVLTMFDEEQMGNWSKRQYNKSGIFKYVTPAIEETYGRTWPFIYALKGSCETHRTFLWTNRAALLDAKYGTADFRADLIDCYVSRTTDEEANTIRIVGSEEYAYGYGTINNPNEYNTGVVEAGTEAVMSISGARTINDPIRMYGASRMVTLDMSGIGDNIKNALDLSFCSNLREFVMTSNGSGSTGWYMMLSGCKQLRVLNLNGQQQARTGSTTSTELDLSQQQKLQSLDCGGTRLYSVIFAKGAPVTSAILPDTIKYLYLEYLPKLTMSGLNIAGYSNVVSMVFDNCPGLDWETIKNQCPNLERLRVTGIDREDDGTWLNSFMNLGGIDSEGNTTTTCALVGTVHLTKYMDDETYATASAHFPELNIIQPEYTMVEFDDSVSDDANVSNLDNKTGYKYGNDYVPSAHINAILSARHRVLSKITGAGVATICQLHDDDSNFYADSEDVSSATAANLDASEGDVMMYEPHYWFKGINDYLNHKHYSCYSFGTSRPSTPDCTVKTWDDLVADTAGYRNGYILLRNHDTIEDSLSAKSGYAVLRVDVSQHSHVRFPTVVGESLECSLFVDESDGILSTVTASSLTNKFENGMYLICDVPSGAKYLYFTISTAVDFDNVVLSNSDKIEDMEPDWVEHEECLTAVFGSVVVNDKLRSCANGDYTLGNMSWTSFNDYSAQRGMQQIDYEMHRDIANLFYIKYGRRNSQMQCGAGAHTNSRTTGATALLGMQDTVNTDGTTVGGYDSEGTAFYRSTDAYGTAVYSSIKSTNCLGYEDIYGCKYDWVDNVRVNQSGAGLWSITMPDGSVRNVKGSTNSGTYIGGVYHGKYCDVIPVGNATGSSSTGYCDLYYYSGSSSRVVARGYAYAHAYGGVSCAHANYDPSYASASVGSRLAFRGQIVKAQSVASYKALSEIS
ncbi:MAG: hypothetical protein K6E86_02060 [Bacteroidales bacterium]|nr:hypothetical protein [Bacteroidales bacterium]